MSILSIIVPLIVAGLLLWAVNANVVVIVLVAIWLLQTFIGHTPGLPIIRP